MLDLITISDHPRLGCKRKVEHLGETSTYEMVDADRLPCVIVYTRCKHFNADGTPFEDEKLDFNRELKISKSTPVDANGKVVTNENGDMDFSMPTVVNNEYDFIKGKIWTIPMPYLTITGVRNADARGVYNK